MLPDFLMYVTIHRVNLTHMQISMSNSFQGCGLFRTIQTARALLALP